MAEITARRRGELVRGVFQILKSNGDGLPARELLKRLEEVVPPTDFELTTYPDRPGIRRYEKIVRFSTVGPVKAGWMIKDKGEWAITEEGIAAFDRFRDPEQFTKESDRLYHEWRQGRPEPEPDDPAGDVEGTTLATLEEAQEAAWSQITDYLQRMPPYDLQNLAEGLLQGMGYYVSWVAPPGPDNGIDLIAHSDPLGVNGPRVKVQVKRRADKIAVDGVRSFMAVLGDGDVGLFISTGDFTKDAAEEARRQEKRRVMLVDNTRLIELWVEHYRDIPELRRQLLPLKPVHYLALTA